MHTTSLKIICSEYCSVKHGQLMAMDIPLAINLTEQEYHEETER